MAQSISTAAAREYRIDALAREAGTTVRNVRSYQDRGLLPPPRRSGRVGLYSEAHLARLRMIATLLERGYTLSNIAELVGAWERGEDVGTMLGLEAVLAGPWAPHSSATVTATELEELFGPGSATEIAVAVEVGLLSPMGGGSFRVPNPAALAVGRLLVEAGVPLSAVLAAARQLRGDVEAVARRFVGLVEHHVVEPLGEPVPASDLADLAHLVDRLRPLAGELVEVELARAMEAEIRRRLGEYLVRLAGDSSPAGRAEVSGSPP